MGEYLRSLAVSAWEWFGSENGRRLAVALGAAVILLALLRVLRSLVGAAVRRRGSSQVSILAEKALQYLGFTAIALICLDIAGVDASALLGAAGIAGIALGFAAQTSVSNVISGLFLITEKAFVVGDIIRAGDTTGTVKSIDVLSVKLVTFDNQLVRIPNETLVKSIIINITRHPVRRLNVRVLVPHAADLGAARAALDEAASALPQVMIEPKPFFFVDHWDQEGIWITYGLWIEHKDVVEVKNGFFTNMQAAFARRDVALPRRSLVVEGPGGAGEADHSGTAAPAG
jgi:small-conductance mechanosensitive channel